MRADGAARRVTRWRAPSPRVPGRPRRASANQRSNCSSRIGSEVAPSQRRFALGLPSAETLRETPVAAPSPEQYTWFMATIDEIATDVILRDGSTLRLRPPLAADAGDPGVLRGLSDRSLYLRFHGFRAVEPELVAPLLDPDWAERGALAGWLDDAGATRRRARELRPPARPATPPRSPSRSPTTSSRAAASARACSSGSRSARRRARDRALRRRGARPTTRPCSSVFADAGFEVDARARRRARSRSRFPIAPTERLPRAGRASATTPPCARRCEPFFEPSTVAVIGASRPPRLDRRRALPQHPRRPISPVPRIRSTGRATRSPASAATRRSPTSPTRSSSPSSASPASRCSTRRGRRSARGVRGLVRDLGRLRRDRSRRAARASSSCSRSFARTARGSIGPNCLGISVAASSASTRPSRRARSRRERSASPRRAARSDSRCSRRPASAGSASPRSSRSATRPTSPRTTCSSGGRTTTSTDLVLLYLESFGNPRKFARLARRVARTKPILAMKGGRTRGRLARRQLAHRRARRLGGGGRRALPPGRRAPGRTRSRSSSTSPRCSRASRSRAGRRVAVLTNAGGLGILCADACEAAGLELPSLASTTPRGARATLLPAEASLANPVDLLGSATA